MYQKASTDLLSSCSESAKASTVVRRGRALGRCSGGGHGRPGAESGDNDRPCGATLPKPTRGTPGHWTHRASALHYLQTSRPTFLL